MTCSDVWQEGEMTIQPSIIFHTKELVPKKLENGSVAILMCKQNIIFTITLGFDMYFWQLKFTTEGM